jgi:hypothetical protein
MTGEKKEEEEEQATEFRQPLGARPKTIFRVKTQTPTSAGITPRPALARGTAKSQQKPII